MSQILNRSDGIFLAALAVIFAVAMPFLWPFLGFGLVWGLPLVIIVMVVWTAVREFWGDGPAHRRSPAGSISYRHAQTPRTRIRHDRIINTESDRTE